MPMSAPNGDGDERYGSQQIDLHSLSLYSVSNQEEEAAIMPATSVIQSRSGAIFILICYMHTVTLKYCILNRAKKPADQHSVREIKIERVWCK